MKAVLIVFLLLFGNVALANMCSKLKINDNYRAEAKLIKQEAFAPTSPDYVGDDEYNAWILSCNRDRDSNGKKIDKLIEAGGKNFSNDLPAVSIKGQYSFYDLGIVSDIVTSLKYRYRLRREKGEWILTLPIELDIPGKVSGSQKGKGSTNKVIDNRLDISKYLAVQLGLMTDGSGGTKECDPGQEVIEQLAGKRTVVSKGFIGSPLNPTYDGDACRLEMDKVLSNNQKLLDAYFQHWKDVISGAWSRSGFKVEVLIVNFDSIDSQLLQNFKKDDLIWKIHTTLASDSRPRYRSGFANLPHLYTGAYPDTIAHEAGHELGLDDEYREDDKGGKNAWRDCQDTANGGMGANYLMCKASAAMSSTFSTNFALAPSFINKKETAKAIYPWMITRRYVIGTKEQCFNDSDCSTSDYCTTASLGRNECVSKKSENENCSSDHQCKSEAICKGKPLGKCITESSIAIGQACSKNAQCTTGNCSNNKNICQCSLDSDCTSTQFCEVGTLGIGANTCVERKANGVKCSKDTQCQSPAICQGKPLGKCVVASSVALNGSCSKDTECTTGSCNVNGSCQCNKDSDCGSNATCDKGTLGIGRNVCVSNTTVSLGNDCIRNSQCTTNSCSAKGSCQCKNDSDCSSTEWCDKHDDSKSNVCKSKLASGVQCGGVGELGTGHRCVSGTCRIKLGSPGLTCK